MYVCNQRILWLFSVLVTTRRSLGTHTIVTNVSSNFVESVWQCVRMKMQKCFEEIFMCLPSLLVCVRLTISGQCTSATSAPSDFSLCAHANAHSLEGTLIVTEFVAELCTRQREFVICCWYLNLESELQPPWFCNILLLKACFYNILEFEAWQLQTIIVQHAYLCQQTFETSMRN